MRFDTILMTLGVAVVAVITYFALEFTMPGRTTQLEPVAPQEPPVVVQQKASQTADTTGTKP